MSERQPWDRLPEESAKAYAAFCIYRGLPLKERSRDIAYRLSRGWAADVKTLASGGWTKWSKDYRWLERASAHDEHIEREARKGEERSQIRKLREFRIDQQRSAQTASRQALKALQKAGEKLETLKAKDLRPSEAAAFMQAAARLLESASAQQASALAVDEMLEALTDG